MVINKNETRGAITEKMSTKRIDGYIKSYMDVINSIKITEEFKLKLHTSYLGVMLYLIQNTPIEDALNLIRYLRDQDFTQIEAVKKTKYRRTSTNFEYANKVFLKSLSKKTPDILDEIKKVFSTYLSCKDLEQSLFLGPNEIRACCKRFFVSGEQKGDVVLLPANEKITYEDITKSKKSLVQEINTGTSTECSGCPYIDRYETSKRVNQINYISFENFSYCNMRCTYCSPKYYGGAEAEYDSLSIIDQLFQRPDELSDQVHVVFGGGEPTLSPKFIEINSILKDNPKISKVRILSNSLKYNANVTKLIQNNKYQLVTSIDAGSQEMFTEIRQRGEIAKVFSNLKTYSHHLDDKQRLTVKYIITSQNYKTSELISYIELIKQYDLIDCLFQISCDFMVECPKTDMTIACYELSALLYEAGAQHVFFDDLIRDRIKISDDLAVLIHNKLCTVNTHYDQSGETSYIIWGKGLQANWISQNTMIGRSGHIQATVSDEKELNDLIQKKSLQQDKIKIIPAGVQSTYEIIQNIKLAGFEKNIINSVLL
jgi:organic radical activating enzyme